MAIDDWRSRKYWVDTNTNWSLNEEFLQKMKKELGMDQPPQDDPDSLHQMQFQVEVLTRHLRDAEAELDACRRRAQAAEMRLVREKTDRTMAVMKMQAAIELLEHLSREDVETLKEAIESIAEDKKNALGRISEFTYKDLTRDSWITAGGAGGGPTTLTGYSGAITTTTGSITMNINSSGA